MRCNRRREIVGPCRWSCCLRGWPCRWRGALHLQTLRPGRRRGGCWTHWWAPSCWAHRLAPGKDRVLKRLVFFKSSFDPSMRIADITYRSRLYYEGNIWGYELAQSTICCDSHITTFYCSSNWIYYGNYFHILHGIREYSSVSSYTCNDACCPSVHTFIVLLTTVHTYLQVPRLL